jgi:ferritin-like metal-binding protein YciE
MCKPRLSDEAARKIAKATPHCTGHVLHPWAQISEHYRHSCSKGLSRILVGFVLFLKREIFVMSIETIEDLFVDQIEDLYDAEQRLIKALPKMAEAATADELRNAFEEHLEQTKGHAHRLEEVFAELGKDPKKKTCEAMKGLIKEGDEVSDEIDQSPLRDVGLIGAANRVEHYEIAAYGTARDLAKSLGLGRSAKLLEQTLEEEKAADAKLTNLAQSQVNPNAMRTGAKTRSAR